MADEKMELCPTRYGEDFDFDFDLTAPLEEEDTIIEDITSTEYNVTPQAGYSPMNFDINNKSIKEFDDIDALTDIKNSTSDHDGMSPRNGNNSNLGTIQKSSKPDSDQTYQENVWPSHPEDFLDHAADNDVTREVIWDNEEKFATDPENIFKQKSQTSPYNHEDSQNDLLVKQLEGAIKAPSSQFLDIEDVTESSGRNESYKKTNSLIPSSPNDSSNFLFRSETAGENSDLSDVVVVYQQNEYLLFSTSEFEDPNTFFIKDRTIAQKPLCDFFLAIRNVIYEDLEYESELWLFFPEFDLQIEETSSLLQKVTFLELVTLRKNLLLNDGIDIIQPMYIDLGIRKNFVKEIMRITKNANEGKGLSESVIWNEGYDDPKGSYMIEGGSPSASENQSVCNENTNDEPLEEKNSRHETEHINHFDLEENEEEIRSSEKGFKYESEQDQEPQNKLDFFTAGETSASRGSHGSEPTPVFRNENSSHPKQKKIDGPASINFYDAESDVIDYSEDDLEDRRNPTTIKKPVINECKTKPIWNNKTNTKNMSTSYEEENTNMNLAGEINAQTSEQYVHEENDSGSAPEPITDLTKHVDIQSDDNQVNFNVNSAEKDFLGEQITHDEREINSSRVISTQDTDRMKENITHFKNINLPIRDFPIRHKSNIPHKGIDSRIEPSAALDFMEVSKPSVNPKTFSDGRTKGLLVDTNQEQDIHLSDKLGNEDENENEINYEEEDDDEDNAYKNYSSPKPIRQSLKQFPLSTIGKRPRIDSKHEANMEKRDRKRNRS
ncbi:hypothetical protein OnM2_049058 [Erysiphe neolycopersici]|uniref:Uncharacterized protein n=1 Tax=Erysiphe neolycopersici TaxID=212602 RepID=A0A420HT74_9PEZI|nr:hypothetical protein OnM2_049058 [Erysiphe neolycopersici]